MRKKYGHIIWMAMVMLMGMAWSCCSSDDDSDEQDVPVTGTPIAFSAKEGEETAVNNGGAGARESNWAESERITRSTPLSDNNVTSFTVWGYKNMDYNEGTSVYGGLQTVFPEFLVEWHDGSAATTTTNSSGWEYILTSKPDQTIKYWDFSAKAYRFYAVTGTKWESGEWLAGQYKINEPSGDEITLSADASSTATMTATPYFSKLWFSTGNEALYPTRLFGKPVQLEFLKPYSRVRFIFKYVYPREGINLADISFKPTTDGAKIARKGTVTVHYPKEGTETREWYTMTVNSDPDPNINKALNEFTEDYDPEDDGKTYTYTDKGWYMVLPNDTQGSYTLSVKVNGKTKTAVVPQQYMTWLPGYSYTYIFKITEEGGVEIGWVEYAVTPWSDMEADHMVYNW